MLLVGDIGGTKTDLAIFSADGDLQLQHQATFKSGNYPNLEIIVQQFLCDTPGNISKAIFGVAGPVVKGEARITNLPWHITEASLKKLLNIPSVKLLNDLEAIAYVVPHLSDQDVNLLNPDDAHIFAGHKAIIAPGTGLGEAMLVYQNGDYQAIASEGGHADFAPTTPFEIELLKYLLGKHNHVSYERVCSGGSGILNIYAYLKENGYGEESPHISQALKNTSDPTPVIIQAALNQECDLCVATLSAFVKILGSEAGNMALKVMASGGVYLGGGIPPRILPKLKDGTFMAAFVKKGRFSDMLSHIPVYVICSQQPALLGAAYYALRH